MINLNDEVRKYRGEGLSRPLAFARVCQDVILMAISIGPLKRNVTIKGGIVMRSMTNSLRRATRDIDLDFIHYPLTEEGIDSFISRLDCIDGLVIIKTGDIEELKHQDYHGKRVHLKIIDSFGTEIKGKLDIGVHTNISIEQEEYCFDVCMNDEGVSLLKNSAEQVFVEKLRSLLVWGPYSRRFKDVYDLYYLKDIVNPLELQRIMNLLILSDQGMRENSVSDIAARLRNTFEDSNYIQNLEKSEQRWLDEDVHIVTSALQEFVLSLK